MKQFFQAAAISIYGGAHGVTNIYVYKSLLTPIIFMLLILGLFIFSLCFFSKRKKSYIKNGISKFLFAPYLCMTVVCSLVLLFFFFTFYKGLLFFFFLIFILFCYCMIKNIFNFSKFYSNIKNIIDELTYYQIDKEISDALFCGYLKYGNRVPIDFKNKLKPYNLAIKKFSEITLSDDLIELKSFQVLLRKSNILTYNLISILSLCFLFFVEIFLLSVLGA